MDTKRAEPGRIRCKEDKPKRPSASIATPVRILLPWFLRSLPFTRIIPQITSRVSLVTVLYRLFENRGIAWTARFALRHCAVVPASFRLIPRGGRRSAVPRALRRNCELVFYFFAEGRIHRFRPAERGFSGNVVELVHLIDERILPRKIKGNPAHLHPL